MINITQDRWIVVSEDENFVYTKKLKVSNWEDIKKDTKQPIHLYKTLSSAQDLVSRCHSAKVVKVKVTFTEIELDIIDEDHNDPF
jgi:hypothetical protein